MRRLIVTGSLLIALTSPAIAGQIYQWTDSAGQTHFGSQPPQGVQSTQVSTSSSKPKTPPPAPAPAAANSEATVEDPQKAIDAKVKQDVAKQQAELKKYCETLRTNLSQLENNPRISIEENGESRRLTEKERQTQMAEAQKSIKENCN